jgi:Cu2+-containing amine oxidase
MRINKLHLLMFTLVLGGSLFFSAARTAEAQCSAPYFVDQQFPTSGPPETRWRICFQPMSGNGLVITGAWFQKTPGSAFVRLFWDARISEIFVPYHPGGPRYYDVGYNFSMISLSNNDCPAAKGGTILSPGNEVCKEVRDRGLAWKDDLNVRRGEEVVLWGALDAANYNYVIEWTFRDDGVVLGRVGATAQNAASMPTTAHMHGPIWRLDIDFNGFQGDSVYLGAHHEAGLGATDTMTLIATESGQEWKAEEFTLLHIQDATLKNANGKSSSYHLMPIRLGSPRHDEGFTKKDFWVTRYNPAEMWAPALLSYISPSQAVSNTDVVVWYYGAAHHQPRDEDGRITNGMWTGEAHIMWNGFMLMPHNLFDKTPLCPASLCQ